MYPAVTIFIFMCVGATSLADHHEPCQTPNMSGLLTAFDLNGGLNAGGDYVYDSAAKKLRYKTKDFFFGFNTTLNLDVLMFFQEGFFYEIDSTNESCKKKSLQSVLHPMEIPSEAKRVTELNLGSPTVAANGIKLNIWAGTDPLTKAYYSLSVSVGCLPVSILYLTQANKLIFSNLNTETEIKDPDFLTLPSFCEGVALEETPQGTANSFFKFFI